MGIFYKPPRHQQICWSAANDVKQPVPVITAKDEDRNRDRVGYQEVLRLTQQQKGYESNLETRSAHPILTDKSFTLRLEQFHEALVKAVVNIVDRWWEDRSANFPSRMPLETPVEGVLQWIHEQSKSKSMPAFADCLGNWRPDFLLTDNDSSAPKLGFQVCEINSRTPHNALIYSAYEHGIMRELLGSDSVFKPAGELDDMVDSLLRLYDPGLPIHLVRGRDDAERHEFILLVERKTGLRPRSVSISDLQLRPDASSSTGYALCCEKEGKTEQIYQVALSLFPDEFCLLSQDVLCHLAKLAVNDLRTILFVNDQRFLGIILQELEDLVDKHKILTSVQARVIQEGIVPTVLPGSPELKSKWVDRCMKDGYILKASRQSRGEGHLLGEELSAEEWEAILLNMQDPTLRANTTSYVLQPYIPQPTFDIVVNKDTTICGSHNVGTYYTVNGRFLGLGPWRAANAKVCNVYGSGCQLLFTLVQ